MPRTLTDPLLKASSDTATRRAMSSPERRLSTGSAALLVVASMVGTGVFTTTGVLLDAAPSAPAVMLVWLLGGLAALAGALSYAELAAAIPRNGGEYVLLSRIYHPAVGFVAGFVSLVAGFAAPIAASAIAFAWYLAAAFPAVPTRPAAIGLIALLTLVHSGRQRLGSRFQDIFTLSKVVLIVAFIVVGTLRLDPRQLLRGPPMTELLGTGGIAVGLILVAYAYSGWAAATYVAGEVRRPARALPRSLALGTGLVTALYVGLNAVFLLAAPASELRGVIEVGHVAATRLLGVEGGRILSVVIALGLVSTVGALVMTGPRVSEAMGRDYKRLRFLLRGRPDRNPVLATLLQGALAVLLVETTAFESLLGWVGVLLTLSSALTVAGVFVLRARQPDLPRPYLTIGYPVTPCVFLALAGWMITSAVIERPAIVLASLATVALGGVLYLLASRPIIRSG
ncbi:MAG: amino acid permease [Deltaproteobacteria bacterium]|nr:amino acid permease [Deltaproteobacteria bacterium]